MAANTQIGNVSQYILKLSDQLNNNLEVNISKGFIVNPTVTYQKIDEVSRSIAGITNNTYKDTLLVTNVSVTEEMYS